MRQRLRRTIPILLTLAASPVIAGCSDEFFEVSDPDLLEAGNIDPVRDGEMLARSAFQSLAQAFGNLIVYVAWWAHEARVGDTFPTRNEFGRRFIDDRNGTLNGEVWFPLALATSTGEHVVNTLGDTPGLALGLGAFTTGYGALLMAETFCEGTISPRLGEPGPKMTTQQLLDRAVERLELARQAMADLTSSEATMLRTAALVGIARAHLFAGRKAEAEQAARQVPASFEFRLTYVDDPANRGRLGNTVYAFSSARQSLVVPPEYRAIADGGDPRVRYEDTGRLAQDSELRFYRQLKYPSYATAVRFASGLEARYIAAEASGNVAEQLALINERRSAGRQSPFTSSDPRAVLAELMDQRARDFWLEAKKMGDFRRNGHAVPYVPAAGAEYYKAGVGRVGDQTCWPVPDAEKRNNPNWTN